MANLNRGNLVSDILSYNDITKDDFYVDTNHVIVYRAKHVEGVKYAIDKLRVFKSGECEYKNSSIIIPIIPVPIITM